MKCEVDFLQGGRISFFLFFLGVEWIGISRIYFHLPLFFVYENDGYSKALNFMCVIFRLKTRERRKVKKKRRRMLKRPRQR